MSFKFGGTFIGEYPVQSFADFSQMIHKHGVFLLSTLVGLSPALLVIAAGLVGLGLRRARGWQA